MVMSSKLLALFALLASPVWGTWSLVQDPTPTVCASGSNTCVANIGATGAGNVITVTVYYQAASTFALFSVTGGGAYTECTSCAAFLSPTGQRIAYTLASTAGATTVTVVLTAITLGTAVHVREYAYTASSIVFDGSGSTTGTAGSTTQAGIPLTVLGADLIVQGIFPTSGTCTAVAAPYTNLVTDANNGCAANHLNVAAGTDSPTWTIAAGNFRAWGMAIREVLPAAVSTAALLPLLGAGFAGTVAGSSATFTPNSGACVSGCGNTTATMTARYSAATGPGTTLLATFRKNSAPAVAAPCTAGNDCVSDPVNGNWTFACSAFNTVPPFGLLVFYKNNALSIDGSNVTMTAVGNTNGVGLINEVAGLITGSVLDGCTGNQGLAGSPISATFTSAFANNLLFGYIVIGNGSAALGVNFPYIQLFTNGGVDLAQWAKNPGSGSTSVQFRNLSPGTGQWAIVGLGLRTQ